MMTTSRCNVVLINALSSLGFNTMMQASGSFPYHPQLQSQFHSFVYPCRKTPISMRLHKLPSRLTAGCIPFCHTANDYFQSPCCRGTSALKEMIGTNLYNECNDTNG